MRAASLLCMVLTASTAAGADLSAGLAVADEQDAGLYPYRLAELTLVNAAASAIQEVRLKPVGGGPTVRQRVVVPPGQQVRSPVPLPAIWPVQQYQITAIGTGGKVVGGASADITWQTATSQTAGESPTASAPAEMVTTGAFIDDSFRSWQQQTPEWSMTARRNALLLAAMLVAASAGALFVRRPAVRAGALLTATAIVALLMFHIPDWPAAVEAQGYSLALQGPGLDVVADSFVAVSARQTTEFSLTGRSIPYPVYRDRPSAADDDAVVDPAARTITLTVHPGKVRILRPVPSDSPTGPTGAQAAWFVRQPEQLLIRADALPGRGLLVEDDRAWVFTAPPGAHELAVPLRAGIPLGLALMQPDRHGLDESAGALLRYWRDRHQRGERLYLISVPGGGKVIRADVIQLREATSPSAPSR